MSWASAKERSAKVTGYPAFSFQGQGFLGRHYRTLSATLPRFNRSSTRDFSEKDRLERGSGGVNAPRNLKRVVAVVCRQAWRLRLAFAVVIALVMATLLFYVTRKCLHSLLDTGADPMAALHNLFRRASFLGGGNKFVIMLAANEGGGVMEWKGPREWALERDSVHNKREYAKQWGYDIEVVDMATKKRYAHEWRESWEKVDTIRRCMHDYPNAEW